MDQLKDTSQKKKHLRKITSMSNALRLAIRMIWICVYVSKVCWLSIRFRDSGESTRRLPSNTNGRDKRLENITQKPVNYQDTWVRYSPSSGIRHRSTAISVTFNGLFSLFESRTIFHSVQKRFQDSYPTILEHKVISLDKLYRNQCNVEGNGAVFIWYFHS